jgi:pantoate--beta-alanine ligase
MAKYLGLAEPRHILIRSSGVTFQQFGEKKMSMSRRPPVLRDVAALREAVDGFRRAGDTVALVPTMGALHEGHLELVRLALKTCCRVVVSIFVNPTQFAPSEDFDAYPRTFEADLTALGRLDADLVWAPSVGAMYPDGFAARVVPEGPACVGLEDAARPHFFSGVATVVTKLLLQCRPDIAVFGEKDYQQLKVVTRMVADLDLAVRVVGAPTVREADGLAMSSRNTYLSPDERAVAPTLYRVLTLCASRIAAGRSIATVLAEGREAIERAGFRLDYLEARHAESLQPVTAAIAGPLRLLVAAVIGSTRLIDNIAV